MLLDNVTPNLFSVGITTQHLSAPWLQHRQLLKLRLLKLSVVFPSHCFVQTCMAAHELLVWFSF